MDFSKFHPVEQQEMLSCVAPVIFKCFDGKSIGTDLVKLGMFKDKPLAIRIDGNEVTFALPFNGPISLLRDYLTFEIRHGKKMLRHYNPSDSILFDIVTNDNNTELIATFYTKEFKMF